MSRTLVIDTATAACSVALIDGDQVIAAEHRLVGRGHAELLLPMIAALPDGGRAAHILVDCGPGSFTGVRVGIAAARGLALGWGATLAGYSSTALVAVAAFAADPACAALAVVLEGGHGEVFMQSFATSPFTETGPLRSLRPDAALSALNGMAAVGNGVRHLAALGTTSRLIDAVPRAADAALLPPDAVGLPARPIYGRAPDARTLAERGVVA